MGEHRGRDERTEVEPSASTLEARAYYDSYWETEGWACQPPAKLLDLFERNVSPGARCLDVGCGDGGTSGPWLTEHADYLGVDVSESAVEMARERNLEVQLIEDAADLPFPDETFDVGVCTEVLEHLFEPQKALAEIRRVLRPGGRVITTVPNVGHWRNRLDLAVLGRWNPRGDHLSPKQPWRDPHVRFFTLDSLVTLTKESGFEVIEHGGHTQFGIPYFIPGLRRLTRTQRPRSMTSRIAPRFPRLLTEAIYVVGTPDASRE
jgi:methionine biosynthesis protein MetW